MWKQNNKKATFKNLIETTYEESWYPCNQCEYKTTHDEKLKNHAETSHKESGYRLLKKNVWKSDKSWEPGKISKI